MYINPKPFISWVAALDKLIQKI